MMLDIGRIMFKKLLFAAAVIFGIAIGTNTDFDSIKESIRGASDENARGLSGDSGGGWGSGTGY